MKRISITVNGKRCESVEKGTVKDALESAGLKFGIFPGEGDLQAPCGTGGCHTCMVLQNKEPVRACVTPVEDEGVIETELPAGFVPLRIIHGPSPHSVGGKATPWWLKARPGGYIEVAIWAAGCNLRCPQCQNYAITCDSKSRPKTPQEAARLITSARQLYGVDRMAISGGEPTLNRPWLTEYFKELKRLNPDGQARLHLDSNGTILTPDYIDELVLKCGVTDIGIEPKGVRKETFMEITGMGDEKLVERYMQTQWEGIYHILQNYRDRVFLGVGFPYNRAFMKMDEVSEFGKKLSGLDPEVQVCVLDYFPAFRRKDLKRPDVDEMLEVKEALHEAGLRTVLVQTSRGHFGP
ncbi:radical SAM protein [Methanosarcina sp. KYL-1]|uniref:radical SAM protein n=1 Tax=Methanosarcina sp. KYL-1 TaxID=2602068 RepID=UPI002100B906|nr:radical SAM protein [Methanosarcina sp. KYL-1]MCQ1535724.1 radical SAM protein [Methanosarcina sp. KYL-1]